MFNDSDSPQSDYSSLCSWLNLPQTQQVLQLLKGLADSNISIVLGLTPKDHGDVIQREQLIGETRGLQKLDLIIKARTNDLQLKLNLKPDAIHAQDEEVGNQTLD